MLDTAKTETTVAPTVEVVPERRTLDRYHDRCDSCKAQAFMLAYKGDYELLFCGHHGNKNLAALIEKGWTVQDDTAMINEKPSPSANHEEQD
jgi:thiamine monophosphate kinase